MKKTLFDTSYAYNTDLKSQVKHALPFLIKNKNEISLSERDIAALAATNALSRTPMSELFKKIVLDGKLDIFYFMNFSDTQTVAIPEILLMDQILIDGSTVEHCPEFLKKVWTNITPYLYKKKTANDTLRVSDNLRLFNSVVLGALCRSYNISDGWLTPTLAAMIIKMYSTTISLLLQIAYNLTLEEYQLVQTLFSAYYADMLGSSKNKSEMPYLLNRCGYLGSLSEISARLSLVADKNKDLSLDVICEILRENGPGKMRKFNKTILLRLFAMSAADNQTMLLALEYPPYFVFVLLKNISGHKNPTISNMIKKAGFKKDIDAFVTSLLTSPLLKNLK